MSNKYDYTALANEVIRQGLSLAESYEGWTKLAFSLSTLGESGRSLFHGISGLSPKYSHKESDRKFDEAMRNNRRTDISSFIWMCQQAGIDTNRFFVKDDNQNTTLVQPITPPKAARKNVEYIPFSFVEKSASYKNTFIKFLCGILDRYTLESPTIERLMDDYAIGSTKDEAIIYWQIDIDGKVHDGKIQHYKETGHRVGGIDWVHSKLRKAGTIKGEKPDQCLFGEHLLRLYPEKIIALVESEKNALIGSAVFPEYNWLATGCKGGLNMDKLKVLSGRTVVLFPDVDGFNAWSEKAKQMTFCKAIVSDLLENNATDEDRAGKIDIADWLIRYLEEDSGTYARNGVLSEAERTLQAMKEANPALQLLIDTFDLKLVS